MPVYQIDFHDCALDLKQSTLTQLKDTLTQLKDIQIIPYKTGCFVDKICKTKQKPRHPIGQTDIT
jgi:hypothetical protein